MKQTSVAVTLIVLAAFLISCGGTPEPQIVEKEVTSVVTEKIVETVVVGGTPEVVEKVVTTVVEVETIITATPEPVAEPAVGGTLVVGWPEEPPTLDAHLAVDSAGPLTYLGGTLVTIDPEGEIVPYLAESWEISEDGLTWDFKLREDVKFHDGTPLTAHEYAWTFQRIKDPATKSMLASTFVGPLYAAEALDDYTLRLKLAYPHSALLIGLDIPFLQPLSPAAVEEHGDQYGRHPVGVGPYMLKEWATGDKIVLERNPDYTWGPNFVHEGPPLIETIEFRLIPETATLISAMEAGEIDLAELESRSVARIEETGTFQVWDWFYQGMAPALFPNTSRPPFDDVKVRQALNLALDREAIIKVVLGEGNGTPQLGPASPSMGGYWPGVEYIGYPFDLEKAKELMVEAGYTYDDDGMLLKDGEPFEVELGFSPSFRDYATSVAQVVQQQLQALGIAVELGMYEWGVFITMGASGEADLGLVGYNYWDVDILNQFYHTNSGMNMSHYSDPVLDEYLDNMRTSMDQEDRQKWADEAQRRIVEQAVVVPIFTSKEYKAVSDRVQGEIPRLPITRLWLNDAYLVTE
jgi:peptide/nickel transport system substrate-binding protein